MITAEEVKEVLHDEKNIEVMFQNLNILDRTAIFAEIIDFMFKTPDYYLFADQLMPILKNENLFLPVYRMLPWKYKGMLSARMIDHLFGEPWFKTGRMTPSYAYKIKMLRLCEELKGE